MVLMLRALEDGSSARGEVTLGCARLHNSGSVRANERCGTNIQVRPATRSSLLTELWP